MEFLASNGFGSSFYTACALATILVVWRGYYQNQFDARFARMVSIALVLFTIFYLGYRFGTGYTPGKIEEEAVRHAYYVWWAALHGTLSFVAIIYTCILFYVAEGRYKEGRNYFREHPLHSFILVLLWPVAILFGILL